MFWREDETAEREYRPPEDVFDLLFRLRGDSLDIDHAYRLLQALKAHLDETVCARIGVHGVRLADSGNGWIRPEEGDAALPLSKRSRLIIRVHEDDHEAVSAISDCRLDMGAQSVEIGASSARPLSTLGTLYARAVCCEREQDEEVFLADAAAQLGAMGIDVGKMICGKSHEIRVGDETRFTRALLVADLKPEESIALQRQGIGEGREIGCGLFVPHKGIDAV